MTYFPKTKVEYSDSFSVDAFGKLRTSSPRTIFDSKQLIDKDPQMWAELLSGSSTSVHTASLAQTVLSVPASDGACAIRQTKARFDYQPGKSSQCLMTGRFHPEAGVIKRVGQFDSLTTPDYEPYNGIYFEMSGTIPSWCVALTGGCNQITQENWNIDRLDGTGISGISMSFDNSQIITFDYEWLGIGRVRTGFVVDGGIYYCHAFNHANNVKNVYMGSPNLPLRYEIRSAGSAGSMVHNCTSIIAEQGSGDNDGSPKTVSTGVTHVDANTANTYYAIVGVRLAANNYNAQINPESISVMAETNDDFHWILHMNPAPTGSINWVKHEGRNVVEVMSGSNATITFHKEHLGEILAQGYSSADLPVASFVRTEFRPGVDITGSRDQLFLSAAPRSINADFLGAFSWKELV